MGANEAGVLERFGTSMDQARAWLRNIGKLAFLMGKGAYLVTERRKLLERLGQKTFEKWSAGSLKDAELESLAQQIQRLSKKLELEEMLVNHARYGRSKSRHRPSPPVTEDTNAPLD